jgi:hypothetical protein
MWPGDCRVTTKVRIAANLADLSISAPEVHVGEVAMSA